MPEALPLEQRPTSFDPVPFVIDLLFARGLSVVDAGVCPLESCGALSDHLPIWATFALPAPS